MGQKMSQNQKKGSDNPLGKSTNMKVRMAKEFEKFEERMQQKMGEAEDESMVPIHQMKVQLPLENWYDILPFVPRSQLGNLASQIRDHQFAYILQSFLHDEVRKITLGKMEIIPPRQNVPSDRPKVHVMPNAATKIPNSSMPGNIKNFKEIVLNYVDMSILHFLEKFQQNSLLTDVNMFFDFNNLRESEDHLRQMLANIAPFITSITSIDSIKSLGIDLFKTAYNTYHGNNHQSQLLLKEMMAKTRILVTNWNVYADSEWSWKDKMDWCCSWLYTPRDDGKPRMLQSYNFYVTTECTSFIERIKKDFKMANHPVSFFVYISIMQNDNIEDISFENHKTNEKLVIKKANHGHQWEVLLISRYPLNAAKNWIESNEKEISEWDNRKLDRKITLEPIMIWTIVYNYMYPVLPILH